MNLLEEITVGVRIVKRRLLITLVLLALMATAMAQTADHQATLNALVEAERAFCKTSIAKGTREAFIENLADDSVLFRPHAVAGKKWTIDSPARPGLLVWWPIYADAARSGDLGYTTGPYEFRPKGRDDKEIFTGNYMTIWRKQADGTWKVAIDFGISNPPPPTPQTDVQFAMPARRTGGEMNGKPGIETNRAALLSIDREFSQASEKKGARAAFSAYLADDARLFRDEKFPFVGKQAAATAIADLAGILKWQPTSAEVSAAGDMGYTYGVAEFKAAGADKVQFNNYVRIWKRQADGRWKIVIDVTNPCPPPPVSATR
jgi:ketosteroid isomerase-like protein